MSAGPSTARFGGTSGAARSSAPAWHRPWRFHIGPELMLLAVAVIWGGSYAFAKQVTLQVTVLQYLSLRFGLTALLLTPALLNEWRRAAQPWGWAQAMGLGVMLLGIFVCETVGITLTTATHAAFLISLCVAFTPLVEWLVLGQRPSLRVAVAVALCVLGAALLSPGVMLRPLSNLGDALMLLAALLRALMVTFTRRSADRIRIPALALTAVQAWVVFVGSTVALLLVSAKVDVPHVPADAAFWLALAFLVVFCTIFAFFAQNHAASRTSPTRVSFLMGSEPVFGAVFGWLMFADRLMLHAWLGCALILVATYVVVLAPGKAKAKAAQG